METSAARAAHWAEALSALTAAALSVWMLWRMLPPDARTRAEKWWADLQVPYRRWLRERRIRSELIFEVWMAMEALEDPALAEALEVA